MKGQLIATMLGIVMLAYGYDGVGFSVVLLAGGVGSRMKAAVPKQFLQLAGKTVLEHSVELFTKMEGVEEYVDEGKGGERNHGG